MVDWLSIVKTDKETGSSDRLQPKQADLSCVHALNELHLHEIRVVLSGRLSTPERIALSARVVIGKFETANPVVKETANPVDKETANPVDKETANPVDKETANPSDTKVFTMTMEILLEPTSNKLFVGYLNMEVKGVSGERRARKGGGGVWNDIIKVGEELEGLGEKRVWWWKKENGLMVFSVGNRIGLRILEGSSCKYSFLFLDLWCALCDWDCIYYGPWQFVFPEQVENGVVELYFVNTEYQLAEIFTKALGRDRIVFLINKLGMQGFTPETLKQLADEAEEFDTSAGYLVKEILLKFNLPDHRILKDGGEAIKEELNEYECLEVWELVPRPDKVMVITLKWIYKVKLDELGGILKNKARWLPLWLSSRRGN
ncbi:hypothetical protein Tco_0450022 [Tanacetum coccineum]